MRRWQPLTDPVQGWSIVIGVPWALRALLPINLQFLQNINRDGLDRIILVVDRAKPGGADEFFADILERFSDLPLTVKYHPPRLAKVLAWIHRSKFYAATNWTIGIADCRTQFAIMHDFDLYPLDPDLFTKAVDAMRSNCWKFTGAEHASFDGLTPQDNLIGTWNLGVDVAWVRNNHKPIDCYHGIEKVNGRWVDLDPFSPLQNRTPQRGIVESLSSESFSHVTNLCSTYLSYSSGTIDKEDRQMDWRLHMLWYLLDLTDNNHPLDAVSDAMQQADTPFISIDGHSYDFSTEHHTCGNVVRDKIEPMENILFGQPRPQAVRYMDESVRFFDRFCSPD